MRIIVTGASGYIGSQLCKEISKSNENYLIALDRNQLRHNYYNEKHLGEFQNFFSKNLFSGIDCVIHLAGSSLISPSMKDPRKYYENNVMASIQLLNECIRNNVKNFIFASSASVYGNNNKQICKEDDLCVPLSPYARSKYMVENIINDYTNAYKLNAVCLRLFNVAGADRDLEFGPSQHSTHIISRLIKSTLKSESFTLNGNNYKTRDGSCIRDYIHVEDVAKGILKASQFVIKNQGFNLFNIGEGNGFSNLEIIKSIKINTPLKPNILVGPPRTEDASILIADTKLSNDNLCWHTHFGLEEIIKTSYEWYKNY